MAHEVKNFIQFDGGDDLLIYFSVRSRSRDSGDEPLRHAVAICKRTGVVSCSCEDAMYRKKVGYITDRNAQLCWHASQTMRLARSLVGSMFGTRSKLGGDE